MKQLIHACGVLIATIVLSSIQLPECRAIGLSKLDIGKSIHKVENHKFGFEDEPEEKEEEDESNVVEKQDFDLDSNDVLAYSGDISGQNKDLADKHSMKTQISTTSSIVSPDSTALSEKKKKSEAAAAKLKETSKRIEELKRMIAAKKG